MAAAWLRLDTFPKTYFADELIPRAVVRHMLDSHSLDTNWAHADWHGDFAGGFYNLEQYNFSSYHTALWVSRSLTSERVPDLVLYRFMSLLFQLLSILLVFATANRLGGYKASWAAAAFLVVMPQAVVDAHYARPESFVILLVSLACWLAVRAQLDRRWLLAMLEAAVWGVACACKFSFFPMALLACAAQCYTHRQWRLPFLWLASFVAGVALSAPYILLDWYGFMHGVGLLLNQYQPHPDNVGWLASVLPSAHQLFPYLLAFFGAPALLLVLLSLSAEKKNTRYFAWVSLSVSGFYVLLFAHQGVFFERNLSHLLPLWSILFALGFLAVTRRVSAGSQFVLLLLALLWPAFLSMQIADNFFRHLDLVKQGVAAHERDLQSRFPGNQLQAPPVMSGPTVLYELPANALLRIPQHKLEGLVMVEDILQKQGFKQVDRFALPLSFLPYNQLQINHFPPAYAYYLRENAEGVQP